MRIALGSFYPVLLHFRGATVAAVDAELQMLCMGPLDAVGTQALRHLFEFFRAAVKAQVDYEMVQALLELTDGNLVTHLRNLETAGYLTVHKQFLGRKPHTAYTATPKGLEAFRRHLDALETFIRENKR